MSSKSIDVHAILDGELCIVTVNYIPGSPAQGPSYSHGGIPGDPPEVEIIAFCNIQGLPAPELLSKYNEMSEEEQGDFQIDLVNKAEEIVMDDEADIQSMRREHEYD